jgi:RNA polymerase sigma-70 factor (ECF subfamily)
VALTNADRALLDRCLEHRAGAWNEFVDRFLGLIYHVIHHTAHLRSMPIRPEDIEDMAAEVMLRIVANDHAVLRQFRRESSLSTYLTVIARRICIEELTKRGAVPREVSVKTDGQAITAQEPEEPPKTEYGLETLEEVNRLLNKLPSKEREIVRLFYLEGRSYEEISTKLDVPVNTIGPILSRARKKLRKGVKSPPPIQRGIEPKPEQS